jgi:sugar phosphate isomerase/epimerase
MRIGMLGRFFGRLTGGNWRPPADELRFAREAGFDALQVMSRGDGIEEELGIDAGELGELFAANGLEPVLELLVFVRRPGAIPAAVRSQLDAIRAAGFTRVHVHPAGSPEEPVDLAAEYAQALELVAGEPFLFAAEHNAPGHRLLVGPGEVESLLERLPGLGLIWDINHTPAEDVPRFLALRERFTMVHVSDTPLPETNHHLPLGRGAVDLSPLAELHVPLILEIGGLPHSGGPGLDTDEALVDSRRRLVRSAS